MIDKETTDRPSPLAGIRVLDFSHQAAGPWATTLLGDLGADVIKIEKPGRGDAIRHAQGEDSFAVGSLNFWGLNRSKRGLAIDIGVSEGRDLIRRLVPQADVVLENFRPGVMDRKGLGWEDLHKLNPRLIYCAISAFGTTGPMAEKPGMDLILQATGGIMAITGEGEGRTPVKAGPPVADITTGIYAALAVTTALYERERSGQGQKVDLSMLDAVMTMLVDVGLKTRVAGIHFGPFGTGHPDIAPYQAFQARDGYFIVACLTGAFWKRLPAAIGRPEMLDDPRYRGMRDRVKHKQELARELQDTFMQDSVGHWIEVIEAADIPTCRVNSLEELFALPQLEANETFVRVAHPTRGEIEIFNHPIRFRSSPAHVRRGAPGLGQHNDEVLEELGIDVAERERLRAAGAMP